MQTEKSGSGGKRKKAAPTQYMSKKDAGLVRERKTVVVEREMERIFKERGALTTALLVEEAEREDSPLHKFFEWDDTVAARKYRIVQATQMIMASKFVCVLEGERNAVPKVLSAQPHTDHMVRRFLPSGDKGDGYVTREQVLQDVEERRLLVERKKSALRAWCRSIVDIEELSSLREMIEAALGQ